MINPKNHSVHPNQDGLIKSESSSVPNENSLGDQKTAQAAQHHLSALSLVSPSESAQLQDLPKTDAHSPNRKSTPPLTLQALADANDSSQKIANYSTIFLESITEKQPKTEGDDIDKLISTEPVLYDVLKRVQSQTKSLPLPSMDALKTQWMISKVGIATAIAKIFMVEPDREQTHNFVTLKNVCAQVYNMIREKEGDAQKALEILDTQSKFQALNQLMDGLTKESKATPPSPLSSALPRILSQIVSFEDLEQVKQYSQLI